MQVDMDKYLHFLRQRSTFAFIVIALLVAHLLPLWVFKYFPSQDGASHIYNAYLLKEYSNPAMYKVRECFELNLTLFPNWFSHALMAGLMFVVSPLVAEKILLTLCIALAPLSLFYFLRAIAGGNAETPFGSGNQILGLLGFLFGYNYLLHMGFYNFAISFPVFFFLLGYWWRHHESMSLANIGALYALMILLYFCHISSYGLILVTLSICALRLIVTPRKLLIFAGYMLPAGFIMVNYLLNDATDKLYRYWSSEQLWDYFLKTKSLVYFNESHVWANYVLLGFIALLILWTLWKDKIQPRRWLANRDLFLILSIVFVIAYFKAPRWIGDGGYINERIHIFWIPILLPWLNLDFHKTVRWCAVGLMVFLSVVHLGYTCRDYYGFNRSMEDYAAALDSFPDHIVFENMGPDNDDWDDMWQSEIPHPHCNLYLYHMIPGDRVFIGNYEAQFNYFPLNFKDDKKRHHYPGGFIDYRLGWNVEEDSPQMEKYRGDYGIVHSTPESRKYSKPYRIFRHRYHREGIQAWEKYTDAKEVNFQMQAADATNPVVQDGISIPVFVDTRYQPGGFGWDTVYPRHSFLNTGESKGTGVWDTEDAAFRIDLRNGEYEVTCRFQSNDGKAHRIELYANGRREIRTVAPDSNEIVKGRFTVEVGDGTLILVIHASGNERRAHWVWSGFKLRRMEAD